MQASNYDIKYLISYVKGELPVEESKKVTCEALMDENLWYIIEGIRLDMDKEGVGLEEFLEEKTREIVDKLRKKRRGSFIKLPIRQVTVVSIYVFTLFILLLDHASIITTISSQYSGFSKLVETQELIDSVVLSMKSHELAPPELISFRLYSRLDVNLTNCTVNDTTMITIPFDYRNSYINKEGLYSNLKTCYRVFKDYYKTSVIKLLSTNEQYAKAVSKDFFESEGSIGFSSGVFTQTLIGTFNLEYSSVTVEELFEYLLLLKLSMKGQSEAIDEYINATMRSRPLEPLPQKEQYAKADNSIFVEEITYVDTVNCGVYFPWLSYVIINGKPVIQEKERKRLASTIAHLKEKGIPLNPCLIKLIDKWNLQIEDTTDRDMVQLGGHRRSGYTPQKREVSKSFSVPELQIDVMEMAVIIHNEIQNIVNRPR